MHHTILKFVGNRVRATRSAGPISGFYDPHSTDTLLDLRLREGFNATEFETWFASLGAESLVFLDSVRSLRFARIGRRNALVHHELTEVVTEALTLPSMSDVCKRTILCAPKSGQSWERYEIEPKMPLYLRRRYKAREDTTPIAIALPSEKSSMSDLRRSTTREVNSSSIWRQCAV